jgi:8-oxo-dGTP diphosphatase
MIMICNKEMDRLLMCKRRKEPCKGLSNPVGGKTGSGENGLDAAYRELYEETGISREDVTPHHLMDFTYYMHNCYVEVCVGRLKRDVETAGDENELY